MSSNGPHLDAEALLRWLRGVIKDMESPSGEVQQKMTGAAKEGAEITARAASGMVKQRTGKLFHAIRNSYRVTREFGDMTVIVTDFNMMDRFIPPTRNPYIGTIYRPYWRLLLEGWGQGGYYNLALIYNYVDGSLIKTSPFNPGALNPAAHERVTFVRHPGAPARDWLRVAAFPVEKKVQQEADAVFDYLFTQKSY